MNRVNQVSGEPKGDPFNPSPFTFPSSHTPPFIFRFTWGAGREGEEPRRGRGRRGEARNAHLLWPTPEPAQPPPPAATAAAKPRRSPCTEVARSERPPGPRHPRRRARRRAPSSASLQPPLPARPAPLGPTLAARGPSQTPWARDGCSGRKGWPRLGPGRRGSEQGGGAPGTESPATRRGRARRDAGSSRSAAGARWRRQREPRDRSITGSHGARAFSSLGAGARLRTRPRGGRAPAPGLLRRAAGRTRERRGELASSSQPAGWLGTALLRRPAGRGPRATVAPFAVAATRRGWCSDCSRRRSKK